MQLKQSQKEQIRNIISQKLSHQKRDELKKEVESNVFDLLERSNYSNRENLFDKLQSELKEYLKDNTYQISEQISKLVYSNDGNNNNSTQKDEDQESNLYKNKFYSDDSDNSDDDDDDDDRRGKRKRNYKKRPSIHQSDLQSDNENKSLSDSEGRENNRRQSRRDSYASNSGKRDQMNSNNKDDKDSSYNRNQNNNQNNGKYPNKFNNNNNRFKNDKKNMNDRNNSTNLNNGNIKRQNNQNQAPLPTFLNSGMVPNLLSNNSMMNFPLPNISNLNLMQPFPNLFTPRMGPPAPPTGKPTTSQAGTGAPSLTLNKTPKNIVYVFYIPPKLNNVAKLSQHFTHKFGAVSAYDKIDDTTASIKFEKEDFAKKAVESKEKPFKIEQIVVTFTKSPAPPKPAFVNKNNNNNLNSNGTKPFSHNKPSLDGQEPPKQKFFKNDQNNNSFQGNNSNPNNNNNAIKPKLQMNFEQKKKQKQFEESKRLIQLKFADKLKVMIFIKQREQDPESEIKKEVQRCIDQIKIIKDSLSKAQTYEDLQQIEQHELIANHQFEFIQKVFFAEGQEMSLTDLRPKLLEYGKVETLKPHLMERAVDVGFTDFQSAEKAYFGLQGLYDIKFVNEHILSFLKNPFQNVVEEQENEVLEQVEYQEGEGQVEEEQQQQQYYQEGEQQQEQQENYIEEQEGREEEEQQQLNQQDENNQEYQEEQGQEAYQEQQHNEEELVQYEEDQGQYADDQQQQYEEGYQEDQQIIDEQQNDDDL